VPMGMSAGRFGALWLIGGVGTVLLLSILTATVLETDGWLGYMRLSKGGQLVEATVDKVDTANHCRVDYRYDVGGVTYHGTGAQCSTRVGAHVIVTYLVLTRSSPVWAERTTLS
jgi:hypothetical protein